MDLDALGTEFNFVAKNLRRIPKWDPNSSDTFTLAEKVVALEGCLKSLELAVSENKASIIQLKDSEINANKRFETIETDIVSLYSKSANYSDIVKGSTGVGRSSPISSPIVVLPGASETPSALGTEFNFVAKNLR